VDWAGETGGGGQLSAVDDLPHILVVDDDRRIRSLLQSFLIENGFRISVAASAAEAREQMRIMAFDLVVLDIMMPGETGLTLTQSLRQSGNAVPVLMLSALAEAPDRIAGLETGSDDYLAKPFEPRELLLRIRSLLKRQDQPVPARSEVAFGPYVFHLQRGDLRKGAEPVRLTAREREFLRRLAANAGTPVARGELAPEASEEGQRSVDVQINRLRQKIEEDPSNPVWLQTVRGAGYVLHVD
jgi:two-component system phosphate regulon response regulator OmpR